MLIDSHVHFWNPHKVDYPFITPEFLGPDLMPLYRVSRPTDLLPNLDATGVDEVVLVKEQARSTVRRPQRREEIRTLGRSL